MGISETFTELRFASSKSRGFVEVAEVFYMYAYEVSKHEFLDNGTWCMITPYSEGLYYIFGIKNGIFYGCLCSKDYSHENF